MNNSDVPTNLPESGIAIIGMAGRFPGARSIDEFWQNIKNGIESVTFFSDEQLRSSGVADEMLNNPNYVKARAVIEDIDMFDAAFFGVNPREAQIIDPQQRIFLECAWEAMENAGYDSEKYEGRVGIYAGTGLNTYLLNMYSNREFVESVGALQILFASDKDFLTTRVSYKLNLTGPSITVQTACSTSLVAVHLACQSLLNGECDIALSGGVAVKIPQKAGHLYQEGSILSPDGHCRAFDARAKGTVSGDGVAIVVLKRLEDALADGDTIHAVIKGSAINNDGAAKAGFTAPSVYGQASVIAEAQAMAQVDPESISYIEAHGTGTTLGDPIEIAALTEAFKPGTEKKGFCAIGSAKTNVGHMDIAAGVGGLIKVIKALEDKKLPPSLHFNEPNPKADFTNSPFYVNSTLRPWDNCSLPRRAGVSSFGMGGTNAHVILEEAPAVEPSGESRPWHLLLLSARTPSALEVATFNLTLYLYDHPEINLADVAYTLQLGRRDFEYRRFLICSDRDDARASLESGNPHRIVSAVHDSIDRRAVFLFSGQGSQYVNMGRELYETEPDFRHQVDHCSEMLKPHLGLDLRAVLYPADAGAEAAAAQLRQTAITQPALFVIEYALARLLMNWGLRPQAMIGHSIGEYVAACLADVLSLEDALRLVAVRGRLMQDLPAGAMLAVPLSEADARDYLGENLSLAAVNSPSGCVISGPVGSIAELERKLEQKGLSCRRLHTSHAFHSAMLEPILAAFKEQVRQVRLSEPKIPYASNLTGRWITADQATDPNYWAAHLRQTVRFAEGLGEVLKGFNGVLLEVGPGETLAGLAKQHPEVSAAHSVVSSMRHPKAPYSDSMFLLSAMGKLWLAGVRLDWAKFYEGQRRLRIPLPTYPFERQRYWVESQNQPASADAREEKPLLSQSVHPRPRLENEYVAPRNELEQSLAGIWQELLGTEQVGIHDDFFSLGGHSLLATQLISQLRDRFEIDLPLHKLFEAPTISMLSVVIEQMVIERVEGLTEDEAQNYLDSESHSDMPVN